MATVQVTNRVTQQALKAQCVRVILDTTETVNDLPLLSVGDPVTVDIYNVYGLIQTIDVYGNSFQVAPIYPFNAFQGSQDGYLVAGDTLTITTS